MAYAKPARDTTGTLGGGKCPSSVPVPSLIEDLADRVSRLTVSHRNPELFFENRSEIAYELAEIARRLR